VEYLIFNRKRINEAYMSLIFIFVQEINTQSSYVNQKEKQESCVCVCVGNKNEKGTLRFEIKSDLMFNKQVSKKKIILLKLQMLNA
jgi:hypothetical protein